jgi:hypothetical protein
MTVAQLAQRLETLERAVERLESRSLPHADLTRQWWLEDAGRFQNDPVFDEIVRLGREYRDSLKPEKSRR